MRTFRTISIACLIALTTATASWAQNMNKLSPRSRIALSNAHDRGNGDTISAFINIDASFDKSEVEALGGRVTNIIGNVAAIRIDAAGIDKVAGINGVKYVQTASRVNQFLDIAKQETGADFVQEGHDGVDSYTGKGVVVGIVDAGFDYTHAAFKDKDGKCRIKRVWEQASTPYGNYTSPEKYGYGIELDTDELIASALGDITNNSHGTHVTGIAAGYDSFREGTLNGTAPEADIVLVSMGESSRDNVNLTNAISYIYEYADEMGLPCVVNLSLGSHAGPHDGSSTFDQLADAMQGKGRLIVGSAGNHRSDKFHIEKVFSGADDKELRTFIFFKAGPSTAFNGQEVDIWGEEGTDFEVMLSVYNSAQGTESDSIVVFPTSTASQNITLGSNCIGTINIASETSPLNNKKHVLITSNLTGMKKNTDIAITIIPKSEGKVNVWADNVYAGLTSNGIEGFTAPTNESTIAEIGGTAKRILSVGAYTTRNEFTIENGGTSELMEQVGDISSFSSYGPTADGRTKPEITAPGCYIISAINNNDATGTIPVAYTFNGEDRTYKYGFMQGTSMSAPFVTGIVATWLQANAELTPEDVLGIATSTARQDEHTGEIDANGDNSWGYGKIDAFNGLVKCLEMKDAGCISINNGLDGSISLTGNSINIRFAKSASDNEVQIINAKGMIMTTFKLGNAKAGECRQLNIDTLPQGMYIIRFINGKDEKVLKIVR